MTEDVSKNDSLQEVCEVFCQCLYDLSSKVGAPITGDCRKCILTFFFFFFHCEMLTLQPGKALPYQIKVRFVRELGKAKQPSWTSHSPDCLVYSHFLFILNSLRGVNFVEAEWALSTCAIVSIDHCEITLIHFIKVTKDFKRKYESLKDKEFYIVCYQKPYSKKTLFF